MQSKKSKVIAKKRLMSLDALRGFDMFFIISGGAKRIFEGFMIGTNSHALKNLFYQFDHKPWVPGYGVWGAGFTMWDIIMPLFLFCSGISMPFSFSKFLERGGTKLQLYLKVIRRTLILYVLGMIRQGNLLLLDLGKLQLYSNALQAIGIGYFISAMIYLNFKLKWQVLITGGIMLLYWALMALVPVPGFGPGVLTPDSNLAIHIDNVILGRFGDGKEYTWILSSMVFGASLMLGVFAGQLLKMNKSDKEKVLWLLGLGAGAMIVGLLWSPIFPIIKYIWTSSMVLFIGGQCFILMGLFYLIIDVLGFKKWAFIFIVIGMNSITAYMSGMFIHFSHTANVLVQGLDKWLGNWTAFVHAVTVFALIWFMLYLMYKKKIFVRI